MGGEYLSPKHCLYADKESLDKKKVNSSFVTVQHNRHQV